MTENGETNGALPKWFVASLTVILAAIITVTWSNTVRLERMLTTSDLQAIAIKINDLEKVTARLEDRLSSRFDALAARLDIIEQRFRGGKQE